MERVSLERAVSARKLLQSLRGTKSTLEERQLRNRDTLRDEKEESIKAFYREDIKKVENELLVLKDDIERTEAKTRANKVAILTHAEFLELMEKVPKLMATTTNMRDLDFIGRKFFSNFYLKEENVENATLSAPFDELYELKLTKGGRGETRTPNPCGTWS